MCSSALCGPQRRHIPGAVVLWYSVATLGPIQHGAVRARFARGSLKFVSSHAGACRTEPAVTAASSSRVSGPDLVLCRRHHEHDTSSAGGFEFAMSESAFTRVSAIDPRKQAMPASRRVAAHFTFASLHRTAMSDFPQTPGAAVRCRAAGAIIGHRRPSNGQDPVSDGQEAKTRAGFHGVQSSNSARPFIHALPVSAPGPQGKRLRARPEYCQGDLFPATLPAGTHEGVPRMRTSPFCLSACWHDDGTWLHDDSLCQRFSMANMKC
jgi:hypothetical protein